MANAFDIFAVQQESDKKKKFANGIYYAQEAKRNPSAYIPDVGTYQEPERAQQYVERNRTFFDDYAARFLKEHPEYEGEDFGGLYNQSVPQFKAETNAIENGAHNPWTGTITLNTGENREITPEDKDYVHEVSHRMRSRILGSSDWGSDDELKDIKEAYDFIEFASDDPSEMFATNTELRKKISDEHGGVLGGELDSVISNMSDAELIGYLKDLNGYTRDRKSMFGLLKGGVSKIIRGNKFKDPKQGERIRQALIKIANADGGPINMERLA